MSTEVATKECTFYGGAVPNPNHAKEERVSHMNELAKQLKEIGEHLLGDLQAEWADGFKVEVTDGASPFVSEEFRKLSEIERCNELLFTLLAKVQSRLRDIYLSPEE